MTSKYPHQRISLRFFNEDQELKNRIDKLAKLKGFKSTNTFVISILRRYIMEEDKDVFKENKNLRRLKKIDSFLISDFQMRMVRYFIMPMAIYIGLIIILAVITSKYQFFLAYTPEIRILNVFIIYIFAFGITFYVVPITITILFFSFKNILTYFLRKDDIQFTFVDKTTMTKDEYYTNLPNIISLFGYPILIQN